MDDRFAAAWALLPGYLSQHVLLSLCALVLGAAISLPLGVIASRSAAVRWPSLFAASLIQTIPSLALLALFYPLLLALSAVSLKWFGRGFPALGFAPSLMALTLYSMLPILRNVVTGIRGVDPATDRRGRHDLRPHPRKRRGRDGPRPPLRRRDRDLHHAGKPVPRGRRALDQFPPAALDPVHAGVGFFGS